MFRFVTITPGAFNAGALTTAIKQAQREWMTKVLKEYQKTTRHWKHKVAFSGRVSEKGMTTTIEVDTDDKIYGYVDEGTRPHIIRAKKPGGVLAFPSMSVPKTQRGSLISVAGKKGKVDTFRREVKHPGTEARDFTGQIREKMEPMLEADLREAMGRGAKKSGHAM